MPSDNRRQSRPLLANEKEHLSPRDRVTSANSKLNPKTIVTGTTSDIKRQSSPLAHSALSHFDNKTGSLENLKTIEDLDDAFYNSTINKHNQAEGNQILTKANSLSETDVDQICQTKRSNWNEKSNNEEPQLNKEGSQKPIPAEIAEVSSSANAKAQETADVDNSVSVEEIILPSNINLTYSRYNDKKKTLSKNKSSTNPLRPNNMDSKEKAKPKSKQSKKKVLVEQDEESYHIAMAGHMPQVLVTDAFSGTGDMKQTVKQENKVEILARLKKGSIYKLFNKPTKVKKFKIKKEKANKEQQEQKKSKGIRKSFQRCIGNIRNVFRACGCF